MIIRLKLNKMNKKVIFIFLIALLLTSCVSCQKDENNTSPIDNLPDISGYPIVSTNQSTFYDDFAEIAAPSPGNAFYGQDANYSSNAPQYINNGDGTITDMITGLMWQKSATHMNWSDAETNAANATTGGHNDWRVPIIKELYSLIDFTGNQGTGDPSSSTPPADAKPFINTNYFDFAYPTSGRYIDVQFVSKTTYGGVALNNSATFFGLNLADGRIKAYPQSGNLSNSQFPARFVRGNNSYGLNQFVDDGDGTITDNTTGLIWSKYDSGNDTFTSAVSGYTNADGSLNWEEALHFSDNINYAGHNDWRLPDAKELHSILDYTRSPDATNSPAIDPIFKATGITNEANQIDYPAYWSSTTFNPGGDAIIIFFGRAMGYIGGGFLDVHGAGCQRTDPKTGTPSYGFGPQGDVRRIYNYVRLVRNK